MDWKKVCKKLIFPPVWLIVLLVIASAVLLAMVFLRGWEQSVVAYGVYALSFYALCVATLFCILVLPKRIGRIQERLYANAFANRYLTDRAFRTRVSMYTSLCVNLLFVAVNLVLWYMVHSWWYVVLAVYYCILSLLWSLLAGFVRKNPVGTALLREWKRARLCAGVLLSVNLVLSGAVLMILYQNKGFHYGGILIYVMALFAFYSTAMAIVEIIKFRKLESPVMSTAKIVSLCAALVSMLNLETAMFAQFGGEMSQADQRIFIILTGAGVSVAVITLAVLLMVKATKEIRRIKYGNE